MYKFSLFHRERFYKIFNDVLLVFIVVKILMRMSFRVNLEQDYTERVRQNLSTDDETVPREKIIYVYTGITLGMIFIAVVKSIYFMVFLVMASKNLHDYIFAKMIKATLKFYNANPSGRILNRFSKDLGIIDEYIPTVLVDVIEVRISIC